MNGANGGGCKRSDLSHPIPLLRLYYNSQRDWTAHPVRLSLVVAMTSLQTWDDFAEAGLLHVDEHEAWLRPVIMDCATEAHELADMWPAVDRP